MRRVWRGRTWRMAAGVAFMAISGVAGPDMMANRNGDFETGLEYWLVDFPKHDFLKNNKQFVSVVNDGSRKNVLKFTLDQYLADNQGVQALSLPIRIDPAKHYKLTVSARSSGPYGRIYVMGKRWKPGVKKHNDPTNEETRDSFKGPVLSFKGEKGTAQFSYVPKTWSTESVEIPQRAMTPLAYSFWENCDFVVIHLVGIAGTAGDFFVDDVKLEEVGPIDKTKIKDKKR